MEAVSVAPVVTSLGPLLSPDVGTHLSWRTLACGRLELGWYTYDFEDLKLKTTKELNIL